MKAESNAAIFTPQEMIYAICVMVTGKLLFGFILGSIASTLANLDTQRVLFEEKLIALKVYNILLLPHAWNHKQLHKRSAFEYILKKSDRQNKINIHNSQIMSLMVLRLGD